MVAKRKETAEQKLLKMIEASSSEGATATSAKRKAGKKKDALSAIKSLNKILL